MKTKVFFEKCKVSWMPGYYIPVRNSWSFHLKKVHLTGKEKEQYEREFGEKILYDYEFEKWHNNLAIN